MHTFDRRTVFAWVFAGMLLVSILPVAMSAKAYAQQNITINGAGATFPFPLIDTWRVEYPNVQPGVSINYQSIGSGGGIAQFTATTVDFGATDAPLNPEREAALPAPAVHIPEAIGSVVPAYNIPGVDDHELKLTGPVLADIFRGVITQWDDPRIAELNSGVPLPDQDIVVVHRSDGSGTTFVWTSYLSLVSPEWQEEVGAGTAVEWPAGVGAPGNEGVANTVRSTFNAIGYVELAYALTTGMDYASVQNQAGNFVLPSLESTAAAVGQAAATLPAGDESWHGVYLLNAPGADSYPIASFTYLLLYKEMSTSPTIDSMDKARAIVDFVAWAISDEGQVYAEELSYVPLPDAVQELDMQTLAGLTYNGEPVLEAQEPEPAGEESLASATLGDNSYEITSMSAENSITGAQIAEGESVTLMFDGPGEVQVTLPRNMISGNLLVNGEAAEVVSEDDQLTTISVMVPEGGEVEVMGTFVVPEFGVIAALVLAVSIVGVIAYARFAKFGIGPGQ
jgi:phosphate transport system permease protein/phosphate transport system substrate-binding protein